MIHRDTNPRGAHRTVSAAAGTLSDVHRKGSGAFAAGPRYLRSYAR